MDKVIVYGLGKIWNRYKEIITEQFDIIAYCDKRKFTLKNEYRYITPRQINDEDYQYVLVCANDFSIGFELHSNYGIEWSKIRYWKDVMEKRPNVIPKCDLYNDKLISVVIPTYNRKERLIRTLSLLNAQTSQNFNIIIVDNSSDYDVTELMGLFDDDFSNRIDIRVNRQNIGMCGNLANAFAQVDEGWIWTLSDDDLPDVNAIKILDYYIHKYENAGVIMFPITNIIGLDSGKNELVIRGTEDFFEIYNKSFVRERENHAGDDFIFFSNKAYNMNVCKKYVSDIFRVSYSGIPHVFPILNILCDLSMFAVISRYKIVNYEKNDGDHWDYYEIAMGMGSVVDWPIEYNEEYMKIITELCVLNYRYLLNDCNRIHTQREKYIITTLYERVYSKILAFDEKKEYLKYIENIKD